MTQTESETITTTELSNPEVPHPLNYPDIKSTVRLFFMLILFMIIVAAPMGILLVFEIHRLNSPLLRSLLNLIMYVVALLITIRYAIRKSKKVQGYSSKVSFNKIPVWLVPIIIIGALAMVILVEQSSAWIPMPKSVQKMFEDAFTKDIYSIINIVIAAPILEEILCRGIILSGLLKNYPPYKAILISTIFFAVVHLNPWQAIPAFFGGLFLGWVYYKTRSVIPGMIIHATINVTGVLLIFTPPYQNGLLNAWGLPYYLIAWVVSAAIFAAGCIIINKKIPNIDHPFNFGYPSVNNEPIS